MYKPRQLTAAEAKLAEMELQTKEQRAEIARLERQTKDDNQHLQLLQQKLADEIKVRKEWEQESVSLRGVRFPLRHRPGFKNACSCFWLSAEVISQY